MDHVLGELHGHTDVLRFVVGFLSFYDWLWLSSCNRLLASSDLRRFVLSQSVFRVPPPPIVKGDSMREDQVAASYYADSFLRHMKPEALCCITSVLVPRTGMHLLNLLCAFSSLRSLRLWDYPYCTEANSNEINEDAEINVAALLQLLPNLQELNVAGTEVSLSELFEMNALYGPEKHVITPTNWSLHTLNLSESGVTDLAPLAMVPQLQSLSVRRTNVSSLEVLETLPHLRVLDISETKIIEFSFLKCLTQLERLDMSRNWVTTDLSALQYLIALRSLKASNIGASDALKLTLRCSELESLHLQETRLTDLDFASSVPNLTHLDIRWTQVRDRRPLASLELLEQLLIDTRERGIQTTDIAEEPVTYEWLRNLHKLQKLRVYKQHYIDEMAEVLQEDIEERGISIVSTRGLKIPMAHRVPCTFLRYISTHAAIKSLELPPLTDYSPLASLSSTLHHVRLQQWCTDDLAQIVALGNMPALTRLSMSLPPIAQVMDLAPLEGFQHLTQLELLDVLFEDLTPLGTLFNLQKLVLSLLNRNKRQLARRHKQHQTAFTFLMQLTNLKELSLVGRVDFKDTALLSGLVQLRRLWLNATKIDDVAPLAALTRLEVLDLGLTPLKTIEGISELLSLQSIWIPEAIDCKALRDATHFPRLRWIWHPDKCNCLWTNHAF
ncbi:hypothetical protein CCR75_001791 [Bremia lactucae]|uniref:Uncharacterized protein n=1 Tax=Bremia lactucae TaxID=4779 RepID=A0A976IH85_BRELC|nr:hypothetical protein CCR75_001791 [Bremia lactucae]